MVVNNTKSERGGGVLIVCMKCVTGFLAGVYDVRGLIWSGD